MLQLRRELDENFTAFSSNWERNRLLTYSNLTSSTSSFNRSYHRLASLQAWQDYLKTNISPESFAFFQEAQNDALMSHIFARNGAWRISLQCLRSTIENTLFCLFYKDHPIELELWEKGHHKLAFSEVAKYFLSHPRMSGISPSLTGLQLISNEYSVLSRAVHGSARSFRMTADCDGTMFWNNIPRNLGSWVSREKNVLLGLNLLLLTLYRDFFSGASYIGHRKAISNAITSSHHPNILRAYHIRLFS